MERFVGGQIVIADFPFSEIAQTKRRPALILGTHKGDVIICKISATETDGIALKAEDFEKGKLDRGSTIVPHHIATITTQQIAYLIGKLKKEKHDEVKSRINELIAL